GCGGLMRACSSCAALIRYITSDCLSPSTPGTYMYRWCRFQIGPIGGEMRSRILGGVRSFTLNSPEVDNGMTARNEGYALRAVMPLSTSGLFNVNERTPPKMRDRISRRTGTMWSRHELEHLYSDRVRAGLNTS